MTFEANWVISGSSIESSSNAFMNAVNQIKDGKVLKKYENQLNQHFKQYVRENLRRSGLEDKNFENSLFLSISGGKITFTNSNPIITERYEYGYSDFDDNNEDFGYAFETSPRYFIRPAVEQSLNEIGNLLIEEANKEYMNRRSIIGDEIL